MLRLVPRAEAAISTAKAALQVVRDPDLSDDAKEAALQKQAKELFASSLVWTIGAAAALGLPAAVVWGLEQMNVGSLSVAVAVALSPELWVPTTIIVIAVLLWNRRKR